MMALRPIQTLAGQRAPQSPQRFRIDAKSPQEALARGRKDEFISTSPEYISLHQSVSQGNGKLSGKMVIARPGVAYFGHCVSPGVWRERTERFHSCGDVGAFQPEKPLSS
jgi:hypothetical protein